MQRDGPRIANADRRASHARHKRRVRLSAPHSPSSGALNNGREGGRRRAPRDRAFAIEEKREGFLFEEIERAWSPPHLIREESLKAMGGEISELALQGLSIDLHGQSLADVI